jgi:hypothetical protein
MDDSHEGGTYLNVIFFQEAYNSEIILKSNNMRLGKGVEIRNVIC